MSKMKPLTADQVRMMFAAEDKANSMREWRECDCCGQMRRSVRKVVAHGMDTMACLTCQGDDENAYGDYDEEESENAADMA